jgi:protein TonB
LHKSSHFVQIFPYLIWQFPPAECCSYRRASSKAAITPAEMYDLDLEQAMTSNSLHRLVLLSGLFIALGCEAGDEAQLGGAVGAGGSTNHSVATPVVEVRGDTPYVEMDGKEVAVPPGSIIFYPPNGPFPYDAKTAPAWVFASNLVADSVELVSRVEHSYSKGKELRFSVDLESPTALDKVWMVVWLGDENSNIGTFIREVGTLRPYKPTTVAIRKRLHTDLVDARVNWHIYAHGREVLHSLISADTGGPEIRDIVSRVREGVMNAEAEPYLTFPPRDSSMAKNPIKLELAIDAGGSIKTASVVDGTDPTTEKSLLEAVEHWWFLPKRVGGRSVRSRVTVSVDLSKWKTWSNDCVTLQSVQASRGQGTIMSINSQEQTRPHDSAPQPGVVLPVAVVQALPDFPEQMAGMGIEGKATVSFVVQPDGTVQTATAVAQTNELFGAAAADCVKQWKFRPALRDGVPVGIRMSVPIVFTAAGGMPASQFDGYYDQAYLNQQYVTPARAQEMAELVKGLKYPVSLSEFHASLGNPGRVGVLRRLDLNEGMHIARYQLTALDAADECYTLFIYYTADERGSFANPRVTSAEIDLAAPLPVPNFPVEEPARVPPQP